MNLKIVPGIICHSFATCPFDEGTSGITMNNSPGVGCNHHYRHVLSKTVDQVVKLIDVGR